MNVGEMRETGVEVIASEPVVVRRAFEPHVLEAELSSKGARRIEELEAQATARRSRATASRPT